MVIKTFNVCKTLRKGNGEKGDRGPENPPTMNLAV
jgi:hypothetical protein